MNKLLYYFDELSLQPESIGLRENLLSISQTFVERLNQAANDLHAMRKQANTDIVNGVNEANKLIDMITEYNKAIAISKDISGNDALTFIDKREVAIEQLSKFGNVTVSYENTGLANVFMNGINVVTGVSKHTLQVQENNNPATGESTLNVVVYDEKKDFYITVNPTSGKLASSQKHYNILLNPELSTNGFSIVQQLDRYANTFAETINSIFATGYGLNDIAGVPAGRVLFESNSGEPITASNIRLSNISAEDIPLSATANTPGNSDIALQLSRIMQDGQFLDGQNPMEFYSNFIGRISQNANEARNAKNASQLVVGHLNSTRDSIMGVNMDEEAISLIKFQKNLEAASRIIATNNQVLSTIINLGL
jgi:flagellar hook-associated protein 1 FlgK